MSALEKLCRLGGAPLGRAPARTGEGVLARHADLARLLAVKNGFFCFEQALHVLPSGASAEPGTLEAWNAPSLWRQAYGELIRPDDVFFAQDIFGGQFLLRDGAVWAFDPETGETSPAGDDLDAWCATMLLDWEVLSGHPLAREWQRRHGPLKPNERLGPKTPFVMGGDFAVENLYAIDGAELMRVYGGLAHQLQGVEDGAQVRLVTSQEN